MIATVQPGQTPVAFTVAARHGTKTTSRSRPIADAAGSKRGDRRRRCSTQAADIKLPFPRLDRRRRRRRPVGRARVRARRPRGARPQRRPRLQDRRDRRDRARRRGRPDRRHQAEDDRRARGGCGRLPRAGWGQRARCAASTRTGLRIIPVKSFQQALRRAGNTAAEGLETGRFRRVRNAAGNCAFSSRGNALRRGGPARRIARWSRGSHLQAA